MGNLMISHILFNLFSRYNIGSFGFRKILAILITVLIFGLLYLTVRFTGMNIPNYTRNLVMLVTVDLAGFLFLMWKRPNEPPKEKENEDEDNKDNVKLKEVTQSQIEDQNTRSKKVEEVEKVEKVEEIENNSDQEKDNSANIIIKKIEEVDKSDSL
jgi:hypothetical protein